MVQWRSVVIVMLFAALIWLVVFGQPTTVTFDWTNMPQWLLDLVNSAMQNSQEALSNSGLENIPDAFWTWWNSVFGGG